MNQGAGEVQGSAQDLGKHQSEMTERMLLLTGTRMKYPEGKQIRNGVTGKLKRPSLKTLERWWRMTGASLPSARTGWGQQMTKDNSAHACHLPHTETI